LYPTYLKTGKGFDNRHAIIATIIGNCGAITCVTHFHFPLGRTSFSLLLTVVVPLPVQYPNTSVGG
jgi:hypothetical protein